MRATWMLVTPFLLGAAHAAPSVELKPCNVEGTTEALKCADLLVAEDAAKPNGRRIKLHVVVVPAVKPDPTRAPLFDLAGGPGISATSGASYFATEGARHRQERDIVLVDQRGTGESTPLRCAELELAPPLVRMYPPEAVRRCRATLATRADLSKYTTQQAVADLEAVRTALGYDRVDVFGLSYGTRLALAWIEHAPNRIRAAALMGVATADAKLPLWHARNAQQTLEDVFEDCEADAACLADFPDLRKRWATILASSRFDGPAREAFRTLLISPASQRSLPKLIDAMGSGDYTAFYQRFAGRDSAMISEGMYLSVTCTEDTQRITADDTREAVAGTFLGTYRVDEQVGACKEWKVPSAPIAYGAMKHDVPVLMLAGDRDYVTPVAWAEKAITAFPRGRLVVMPKAGHMPDGLANGGCLDDLLVRFFASPDGELDTACVATMTPPPFAKR